MKSRGRVGRSSPSRRATRKATSVFHLITTPLRLRHELAHALPPALAPLLPQTDLPLPAADREHVPGKRPREAPERVGEGLAGREEGGGGPGSGGGGARVDEDGAVLRGGTEKGGESARESMVGCRPSRARARQGRRRGRAGRARTTRGREGRDRRARKQGEGQPTCEHEAMYDAGKPVLGAQATSRTQSVWRSIVSSTAHSFVSSLLARGGKQREA